MRISDWSSDVCSSDLGFLAIAGDDHGGKSSDSAHQSEHTLIAAMLPLLYPATIGEIIEFGLFGIAMSRYSGCYVGLKRSEEQTSELQSLMRISYDVF